MCIIRHSLFCRRCYHRIYPSTRSVCDYDEPGELIGKITSDPLRQFSGYTRADDSSKKVLRDVFSKGDQWFRTGDLMRKDAEGFLYFIDRLGDTYRWKGENTACSQVEAVLCAQRGVAEAIVYGVEVAGYDGRAGMACLVLDATAAAPTSTSSTTTASTAAANASASASASASARANVACSSAVEGSVSSTPMSSFASSSSTSTAKAPVVRDLSQQMSVPSPPTTSSTAALLAKAKNVPISNNTTNQRGQHHVTPTTSTIASVAALTSSASFSFASDSFNTTSPEVAAVIKATAGAFPAPAPGSSATAAAVSDAYHHPLLPGALSEESAFVELANSLEREASSDPVMEAPTSTYVLSPSTSSASSASSSTSSSASASSSSLTSLSRSAVIPPVNVALASSHDNSGRIVPPLLSASPVVSTPSSSPLHYTPSCARELGPNDDEDDEEDDVKSSFDSIIRVDNPRGDSSDIGGCGSRSRGKGFSSMRAIAGRGGAALTALAMNWDTLYQHISKVRGLLPHHCVCS